MQVTSGTPSSTNFVHFSHKSGFYTGASVEGDSVMKPPRDKSRAVVEGSKESTPTQHNTRPKQQKAAQKIDHFSGAFSSSDSGSPLNLHKETAVATLDLHASNTEQEETREDNKKPRKRNSAESIDDFDLPPTPHASLPPKKKKTTSRTMKVVQSQRSISPRSSDVKSRAATKKGTSRKPKKPLIPDKTVESPVIADKSSRRNGDKSSFAFQLGIGDAIAQLDGNCGDIDRKRKGKKDSGSSLKAPLAEEGQVHGQSNNTTRSFANEFTNSSGRLAFPYPYKEDAEDIPAVSVLEDDGTMKSNLLPDRPDGNQTGKTGISQPGSQRDHPIIVISSDESSDDELLSITKLEGESRIVVSSQQLEPRLPSSTSLVTEHPKLSTTKKKKSRTGTENKPSCSVQGSQRYDLRRGKASQPAKPQKTRESHPQSEDPLSNASQHLEATVENSASPVRVESTAPRDIKSCQARVSSPKRDAEQHASPELSSTTMNGGKSAPASPDLIPDSQARAKSGLDNNTTLLLPSTGLAQEDATGQKKNSQIRKAQGDDESKSTVNVGARKREHSPSSVHFPKKKRNKKMHPEPLLKTPRRPIHFRSKMQYREPTRWVRKIPIGDMPKEERDIACKAERNKLRNIQEDPFSTPMNMSKTTQFYQRLLESRSSGIRNYTSNVDMTRDEYTRVDMNDPGAVLPSHEFAAKNKLAVPTMKGFRHAFPQLHSHFPEYLKASSDVADSNDTIASQWKESVDQQNSSLQAKMHEIISTLTRHLKSKESAIQDVIDDYRRHGHQVIDYLGSQHELERTRLEAQRAMERRTITGTVERAGHQVRSLLDRLREQDINEKLSNDEANEILTLFQAKYSLKPGSS
ncbi:hypothetical protein GQ53DRAFT_823237 [Thozetella sp. PMI_491]|nr:hypothetical protein GQ53DRAFT_823237 [Thozetella sp. PMI_491]